ncbi:class I SAM-dependent methyltransferase [Mangrovibacterium marinum]|uniref:class I SAM-dependent methyltransferase n=1 Tax=Mangrovibacterium marinum TaxID=1639118 RepID=UPI002A18D529|nr:class I SAM-dependent methyltransferase [Mangrovibacterium marinum]
MSNNFWDQRYAVDTYVYGTEPNDFIAEELPNMPAGKILFPGEGEGRNAVFAARLGWEVTAFDSSAEGKAKAERLALAKGVRINYLLASFEEANFPLQSFDAIALIYTHIPAAVRRSYHQKLMSYLKPGGQLILEGFAKAQINNNTGGPKDINMLWSKEELANDFAELSTLEIREIEKELEEGLFHQGKAAIIRAIATK